MDVQQMRRGVLVFVGGWALTLACGPQVDLEDDGAGSGGGSTTSEGSTSTTTTGEVVETSDASTDGPGPGPGPGPAPTSSSSSASTSGSGTESSGGETGEPPGPSTPPDGEPGVEAELCPDVVAEGRYCIVAGSELHLVGLETGLSCTLGYDFDVANNSLAWIGNSLYGCAQGDGTGGPLRALDLTTGEITMGGISCASVTSSGTDAVYYIDREFPRHFMIAADIESLMSGEAGMDTGASPHGYRITGDPSRLWVSWHSTDYIDQHDLTGALLPPLVLEGHDGWVNGLSRLGSEIIVARDQPSSELAIFDASDGSYLGGVPSPDFWSQGIACREVSE